LKEIPTRKHEREKARKGAFEAAGPLRGRLPELKALWAGPGREGKGEVDKQYRLNDYNGQ
jgi:hypothetical protein